MSNKQKTKRTRFKYAYHLSCVDCNQTWCLSSMQDQCIKTAAHHVANHVVIGSFGLSKCVEWCEHE